MDQQTRIVNSEETYVIVGPNGPWCKNMDWKQAVEASRMLDRGHYIFCEQNGRTVFQSSLIGERGA